jgi:hypothetical protein
MVLEHVSVLILQLESNILLLKPKKFYPETELLNHFEANGQNDHQFFLLISSYLSNI